MGSVCADFFSALTDGCWAGSLDQKAARNTTAVSLTDIYLMHGNMDCCEDAAEVTRVREMIITGSYFSRF